jgi:hypothetical protein
MTGLNMEPNIVGIEQDSGETERERGEKQSVSENE